MKLPRTLQLFGLVLIAIAIDTASAATSTQISISAPSTATTSTTADYPLEKRIKRACVHCHRFCKFTYIGCGVVGCENDDGSLRYTNCHICDHDPNNVCPNVL
ncbi:hypothetical protein BDV96DRAFT_641811 [Lophiotrema nucula]|uniref:Uncharacterized protein n=1 Tax=Lophiotrema nucula TaxID=690887 RepID=A0A6A5ZKY9_9PLEO|nr:hypothetical protein BDV96DRAFT_641811 [Lophiotrema nucula]